MKEALSTELERLIEAGQLSEAAGVLAEEHPADAAELLVELEPEEAREVLSALPAEKALPVFTELPVTYQEELFELLGQEEAAALVAAMPHDERADLLKEVPPALSERIIRLLAQADRDDVRRMMSYPEGTVGAVMTSEYAMLPPDVTAGEALRRLRVVAPDSETIYYVYVVEGDRRLVGVVSLRDLVLAPPGRPVRDLMNEDVISVKVTDDAEEAAEVLGKYDLIALPVVDDSGRLVGIVTFDDVLDIVEQEATEDIYRLAAAGEPVEDYMRAGAVRLARQRIPWLAVLVVAGMLSSYVMKRLQAPLESMVALSFFIPLLLGSAGNAGTQAATTVVRGLATGALRERDVGRLVLKEGLVGLIVALGMGVLAAARVLLAERSLLLAVNVAATMVGAVTLANALGALLPPLFQRLRLDPALMSAPLITTICDVSTLAIYLGLATLLFR